MNIFLAFSVLLVICLFGWFLHKKTLKKLIFYTHFLQFCQNAQTEIGCFQNKIFEIFEKQNGSGDFFDVVGGLKNGNFDDALGGISYLTNDEKNELKTFFLGLGRTDVFGEQQKIERQIFYVNEKIKELKSFGLKKSKLKFCLCISFGAFVFLLLI